MTVLRASCEAIGSALFGLLGGGLLSLMGVAPFLWASGVLAVLYFLAVMLQAVLDWQGERLMFALFYAVDELRGSIMDAGTKFGNLFHMEVS